MIRPSIFGDVGGGGFSSLLFFHRLFETVAVEMGSNVSSFHSTTIGTPSMGFSPLTFESRPISNRINMDDRSDSSTSNSSPWHDRILSVGQFCFIGGLGAILNVLPLILTLTSRLRRHEVNIMIMNLSSADFLLCSSFLFGQTFYILWHERLPSAGCHFLSFFHFTMAFASFIFPPVLAINRYVSLYHNHAYRRIYARAKVFRMMGACWAFCAIVPFVFMMAGKTGFDTDNNHCCMLVTGDLGWSVAYWIFIIFPLIVFCDGTMIYCNIKIYRKLNEHASSQNLDKNVIRKNKEVLYFLIADMLFPVCFHSMYHLFKFVLVHRRSEFLKRFFISLYLLNSVLRGIVTLAMLRPYRSALRRAVCKCLRRRTSRRRRSIKETAGGGEAAMTTSRYYQEDYSNSLLASKNLATASIVSHCRDGNPDDVQTSLLLSTTIKKKNPYVVDDDEDYSTQEPITSSRDL